MEGQGGDVDALRCADGGEPESMRVRMCDVMSIID
jgi:hypothetical protein